MAMDIAQRLLEQALKHAESAEVIYEDSESNGVEFQDNKLKSVTGGAMRGIGLRIIRNGRIGFSSTNDFSRFKDVVSAAVAASEFGEKAMFSFPPQPGNLPAVKAFDPAVPALQMEKASQIVRGGIQEILREFPECHCSGGVNADWGSTVICNSSGLAHEEKSSNFSISIGGFVVQDESFLGVEEGEESSRISENIEKQIRRVKDWIRLSQKEVTIGIESLPVLFTPDALEVLLAPLEMNINGKFVQKGISLLAGRLGERLIGSEITIVDDPLAEWAPASMAIDGEGTPSRTNILFEQGALRGFLFDLQTAGMLNQQSTGNGMRGYSSTPSPGSTNWRIAGGSTPYSGMLSGIKRGILLKASIGAGQSNVMAGDFSVNIGLGFLIENGEIVGRLKDCMLAGNAFDALNRVRAVSSELEWNGTTEAPYICIDSLSVTGQAAQG